MCRRRRPGDHHGPHCPADPALPAPHPIGSCGRGCLFFFSPSPPVTNMPSFTDLDTPSGVAKLNDFLASASFVDGCVALTRRCPLPRRGRVGLCGRFRRIVAFFSLDGSFWCLWGKPNVCSVRCGGGRVSIRFLTLAHCALCCTLLLRLLGDGALCVALCPPRPMWP